MCNRRGEFVIHPDSFGIRKTCFGRRILGNDMMNVVNCVIGWRDCRGFLHGTGTWHPKMLKGRLNPRLGKNAGGCQSFFKRRKHCGIHKKTWARNEESGYGRHQNEIQIGKGIMLKNELQKQYVTSPHYVPLNLLASICFHFEQIHHWRTI